MNTILEIVKKRRSVRKYLPGQIKDNELAAILEAGTYAPSGHNCQPWHFLVIQDKAVINYINEKTKLQMSGASEEWAAKMGHVEQYHIFHNAPTVIIVSGSKEAHSPLPLAATGLSYTPLVDCAAAIQNMLIVAESFGIGSCWIGVINYFFTLSLEIDKLGIPEPYQPYFAVTLGYKANSALELTAGDRRPNVISYIR
jgi:nitroreductase